jgi:flagellar protein FlbD
MIRLHKLSHDREPFHLNPDLIATVDAHPDTILSLTTGVKLAVDETVDEVVAKVRDWRTEIAVGALRLTASTGAGVQ